MHRLRLPNRRVQRVENFGGARLQQLGWLGDQFQRHFDRAPTLATDDRLRDVGGQTFSVTFQSQPGRTYTLEFVGDPATPDWTAAPSVTGTGEAMTLPDTNASTTARFDRVTLQ